MQIELTPTLIEMYRETFEGAVRPNWCWIVSGPAEKSVLGSLAGLTAAQAYASVGCERKSIAAHAAHLRYTLALTLQRLQGDNPAADWPGSFEPGPATEEAWQELQQDLRTAYDGVLAFFDQVKDQPLSEWPAIHVVGLVAMTGHNAYHLGAIRQLLLDLPPGLVPEPRPDRSGA